MINLFQTRSGQEPAPVPLNPYARKTDDLEVKKIIIDPKPLLDAATEGDSSKLLDALRSGIDVNAKLKVNVRKIYSAFDNFY